MMITLLRLFLKPRAILCALLQDTFVAAQIALLPHYFYIPLFLYQWGGILMAQRLEIRLTASLFTFLRHPLSLIDSVRELKILRWLFLGAAFSLLPHYSPSPYFLLLGPIAAIWSKYLPSSVELAASNPLFYLQWKWLIHPRRPNSKKLPSFSFPHEQNFFLSKEFPLLRKTTKFLGEKQISPNFEKKPHILFIFLESFRAKNTGDAAIPASPHFDELAKNGALFTNCYATGPLTFYANIASLSGIQPALNAVNLYPFIDIPMISLPKILSNHGYKSGWFQSAYVSFKGTLPFCRRHGFDEIIGAETIKKGSFGDSWGAHDETLFEYVAEWLKKQTGPTFSNLFTIASHHPWNPPEHHTYHNPNVGEIYNRYLSTFTYTDECLGKFAETLRKEGLLENTILFITGDHGQEMGSENYTTHVTLSEENLHVPLLIYAEGRIAPQRIETPCSHIDLFPTVLDLLKIEDPHHSMGRSLLRKTESPIFFSLAGSVPRWGCRFGDYKWTGLANGKEGELYNLRLDKIEEDDALKNLTISHFEKCETLFEQRAFTRAFETLPDEILRPKENITDKQLEKWLKKRKTFSSVDLSSSSKLTDKSIEALIHKTGSDLRYLLLPKSPRITDKTLLTIAEKCPNLAAFYSQDCPLITPQGAIAILENCPTLKLFSLDRADEITHLSPKNERLELSSLFLGEALPISGASLINLLNKCPDLVSLQVNLSKTTLPQILSIKNQKLRELCFFDAIEFTEEALHQILLHNKTLRTLKITNAPQLKNINLTPYPSLIQVTIENH